MNNYVSNMLENFARIYPFMDKADGVNFFHNVYNMLDQMTPRKTRNSKQNQDSMSEQLNISLRDQLIDLGINEILIDELVSVASRVNYGQVISLPYLIAVVVYIKFFSVGTVYVQVVLIF